MRRATLAPLVATLVVATGLLAAPVGARQSAAVGRSTLGKELDRRHQAVTAVFPDRAGPGRSPATGTLVGPSVVVTAGHVSPRPSTPDLPPWIVAFGPNANQPAKQMRLDAALASQPHPGFLAFVDDNGRNPNERIDFLDVGLLFLPEPAGVAPMALPAPGLLDHLTPRDRFVGVGYGFHEVIRESNLGMAGAADGNRRQWRVGVKLLNSAWMRLEDDPAKGYGQICRGDSGAPILLDRGGQETLVGVVSHSDGQGCGPGIPTYALRVDNPAVLDWIRQAISRAGGR